MVAMPSFSCSGWQRSPAVLSLHAPAAADQQGSAALHDDFAALFAEHNRVVDENSRLQEENTRLRRMLQQALASEPSFMRAPGSKRDDTDLRTKKATVRIGLLDTDLGRFFELGSGVLISAEGHIITAAHTP